VTDCYLLWSFSVPICARLYQIYEALLSEWIDPSELTVKRATCYTFHALCAEQLHHNVLSDEQVLSLIVIFNFLQYLL
jgi:hypothetical protein